MPEYFHNRLTGIWPRAELLPVLEMQNADLPTLQLPAEKIPQLIGEWFASRMLAVAHAASPAARKITDETCPVS